MGFVLGTADAALHFDTQEIAEGWLTALASLASIQASYAVPFALMASVLPWRTLLMGAGLSAPLFHGVVTYARYYPGSQRGTLAAVAGASLLVGAAVTFLFHKFVPRHPRLGRAQIAVLAWMTLGTAAGYVQRSRFETEWAIATIADVPVASGSRVRAPNVVILTLDTLRADRIGVNGYGGASTPNMDRLADEGVLFHNTISHAPLTPPSHMSIFSGLYPVAHGIRGFVGGKRIQPNVKMLAEYLQEAGYTTAAIISSPPLAPGGGIERGFDEYHFELPPLDYPFIGFRNTLLARVLKRLQVVRDNGGYFGASIQSSRAIGFLSRRGEKPFFLWVHYFDAHDPYAPPRRFLSLKYHPGATVTDALDRSYLYDSDVAYLDEELGRLIAALEKTGVYDNTIVVAIADHGEALGEHNYVGHSAAIYNEQTKVPFFIRYPRAIPSGVKIEAQVRSVDVAPTLLALLGLKHSSELDGISLLPMLADPKQATDRTAVSETFHIPGNRLVAVSDGRYKLISNVDDGIELLFDIRKDPLELRNIVDREVAVAVRLRAETKEYVARVADNALDQADIDPSVRQRLRTLGYVE